MKIRQALFIVTAAVLLSHAEAVLAAEHEDTIATRGDVTISFAVTAPAAAPKAAAILFVGGSGKVKLWKGRGVRNKNFLARSRQLFADRGVFTVTVDVASDQRRGGALRYSRRKRPPDRHSRAGKMGPPENQSPAMADRHQPRDDFGAHLAAVLPVDGAVFTASVTAPSGRRSANVYDADLDRIKVPSLIVHHKQDDCSVTPAYAVPGFAAKLQNARKVGTMLFDGGDDPISGACQAQSAHGFLGIESKVVGDIVGWMLANGKR